MMTTRQFMTWIRIAAIGSLMIATVAGCDGPPAVNPWVDDAISDDASSTPSRDGILAAGHAPVMRTRGLPDTYAPLVTRGGVAHYPLGWEDPFEDQGDLNDTFAWTWQDYLTMPYSTGRFLVNTMFVPFSAMISWPGSVHVSNGVLYVPPEQRWFPDGLPHPHDAYPGQSPDPTAGPEDFLVAGNTFEVVEPDADTPEGDASE